MKPYLPIALALITFHLAAQEPVNSGYNANNAGAPILSDQFRLTLNHEDAGIEFYQQNYEDSVIDVRRIKAYKKLNIPDFIEIIPPDLTAFDHVSVLVGVTPGLNSSVVVWLAGNYNYEDVTFFLDYDQDRNFINDEKPLKARAGARPKNITITQEGRERLLAVSVPKIKVDKTDRNRTVIENKVAVGFFMGVGSGNTKYSYSGVSSTVDLTEKNVGVDISYTTARAIFGISGTYQNHFYYTSYLYVVNDLGRRAEHINRDLHPKNRFQWAVYGGPKISLGKYTHLMPMARFGVASFIDRDYIVNIPGTESQAYPMGTNTFFELGVRTEFTVGYGNAMFVEIMRNSQNWNPEGLALGQDDFISESIIVKFLVGYRFSL